MLERYGMFIGGASVQAADGKTEILRNPSTEEALAEVPVGSGVDVDRAVRAASAAFPAWSSAPPKERSLALLRMADLVEARAAEFALLESENVGKPISLAESEMPFIADNLRFFAAAARCLEGRAAGEYAPMRTSWIRREPVGVVGSIAPWNYPLMMAVWKLAPAIAAGNTVVLKPAESTPLTSVRFAELLTDILPKGVVNVVTGHGQPVGQALVEHPLVRMVSLTGDVRTGKAVARAAADGLKRVHLELGGKAPVIVFDDADLERVIASVRANGFINSGQDCTAACRVYAEAPIYERLVSDLGSSVASLRVGAIHDRDTEMGPLISDRQRGRVVGFVERSIATGHVSLVTGGRAKAARGYYFEPTLIADAAQADEIVQNEVFGPVVTVTRFRGDQEAISFANDVRYGLAASVWTQNLDRALEASRRLRFGTVWINDHCTLVSEMPHGGSRDSGYGKDMSTYSVEEYTDVKHVMARRG